MAFLKIIIFVEVDTCYCRFGTVFVTIVGSFIAVGVHIVFFEFLRFDKRLNGTRRQVNFIARNRWHRSRLTFSACYGFFHVYELVVSVAL